MVLLGRAETLRMLRGVLAAAASSAAELSLRTTLAYYLVQDPDPARRAEGLELISAVISAAPPGEPLHLEALLIQALALDAAGRPHISYYDETNDDLKYAAFDGSAWRIEAVETAGGVGTCTSLALDVAGRPHISYYDVLNHDHLFLVQSAIPKIEEALIS